MKEIKITDIEGFRIGHAQDFEGGSGCTVIISDEGAMAGIDVRGGGPAGRETELLNPKMACQEIYAVLLSGGSAFGLDAGGGVMEYLEKNDIGFDVGVGKVPLVCESCIFDLICGDYYCRPDAAMGYAACVDSEKHVGGAVEEELPMGNVGAGTGATVGKFMGLERLTKSGIGSYAVQIGNLKIGAIVSVNALGDIFDVDSGEQIAGLLTEDGKSLCSTREVMWESVEVDKNVWSGNTTIGCIITNAKLNKDQCNKLAGMAHNGYAAAIKPVHTSADGDTIYFMAKGDVEVYQDALGDLGSYVMAKAIADSIAKTEAAYGFKDPKSL